MIGHDFESKKETCGGKYQEATVYTYIDNNEIGKKTRETIYTIPTASGPRKEISLDALLSTGLH